VAFIKRDTHWESDWVYLCGFVPMIGQPGEQNATIDPDHLVTLHYDIDQPIDVNALQGVLQRDRTSVWTEATVHAEEPFDRIWVRLTTVHDGTVRIQADRQAVTSGLCTPAIPVRSPAIAEGDSLAYFTTRRLDGTPGRWQLGAIGHGPAGHHLAQHIIDQINIWDRDRTADPQLLAYPAEAPVPAENATGRVIEKPNIRLVVRY
jgi:protein-L-isoaspartate(D-aspartate) O-methyltransferase